MKLKNSNCDKTIAATFQKEAKKGQFGQNKGENKGQLIIKIHNSKFLSIF